MKKVGIIMGSDSDLPIVKKAVQMLKTLGIPFETHIYSAHRTPEEAARFAKTARENGFGAIIAAAGMAAHLAGAIAANTTLPVIGIPVAAVAINGGANAALLAAQIIAVEYKELAARLDAKRAADRETVLKKDADIESLLED